MFSGFSRRQLLQLTGGFAAGGAGFLLANRLGQKDEAEAQTVNVRENIYTFIQSPAKVNALRTGFQVMRSRPSNNPRSLSYQANIHGVAGGGNQRAWRTCQHGTFFFLSWHRMYLYFFEQILRQASGVNALTLPYWNYSDSANQRALPAPYRDPAASTNSLYVSQRNSGINQGNPLAAADVSYDAAFRLTNFSSPPGSPNSFGGQRFNGSTMDGHLETPHGQLESLPHDRVHSRIGGWMSNVDTAARDPIFWAHHANIDRLWQRWLDQGEGRANPTESNWLNKTFPFFDGNGNPVTLRGRDIVNTAQQLRYRYDDESGAALRSSSNQASSEPSGNLQTLGRSSTENIELSGRQTVTIPLQGQGRQTLRQATQTGQEGEVYVNFEGVQYNQNSDQVPLYEIYLNAPEGANLTPDSPYYAGVLSTFALPQGGTVANNVTDVIRGLQESNNAPGDSISITLQPTSEATATLRGTARSERIRVRRATVTTVQ